MPAILIFGFLSLFFHRHAFARHLAILHTNLASQGSDDGWNTIAFVLPYKTCRFTILAGHDGLYIRLPKTTGVWSQVV